MLLSFHNAGLTVSTSDSQCPGAFASTCDATGFISITDGESKTGRFPSSQIVFLDNGKKVAALPDLSVFMSSFEPFLCVFLRFRSCLNLSETNVAIGRSDGRHASSRKGTMMLAMVCFSHPSKIDR